jgi:hypothetical protein
MRAGAAVCGVVGGVLLLIGATAALIAGGADIVVIGGWVTVAAAVVGLTGGALAASRAALGALLMAIGVAVAGLVAPGVIPAIADGALLFLGYLTGGALLVVGAVIAFTGRKRARRAQPSWGGKGGA